ncbi:unnamed protein product [Cuscuta campestris]|uniref:Uncharacterized protein n=1 Tax=Cuscuta campestris TaxID=132261 RepID=A0A484N7D5_9ASTE|nr:unnamed protein product [Cuscuta campestris]
MVGREGIPLQEGSEKEQAHYIIPTILDDLNGSESILDPITKVCTQGDSSNTRPLPSTMTLILTSFDHEGQY